MSNHSRLGDQSFVCVHCRSHIPGPRWGSSHRNHCPICLWSRHLDERPGDRASYCKSPMEPIGIEVRGDGEWSVIHRCTSCGEIKTNRIAGDDDERSLLALALRPIARPAFPIDSFRPRAD